MWPNTTGFCRVGKFTYFQKSEFEVKHHTNMLQISLSEEGRMARPAKDHTTPAGAQARKVSKTARQVCNLNMSAICPLWLCPLGLTDLGLVW